MKWPKKVNRGKGKVAGLKATKIPDGFVLIQDTREQSPLFVRLPSGLVVKSCALSNGDYSVGGFEDMVCVERKGISDLVGYVGKERGRTVEKMKRFRSMEWVGLVIEAQEKDVLGELEFTAVHPEVIRSALVSFEVRYGVHVYFAVTKEDAGRWVLDRLVKYWMIKHEAS